MHYVSLHHHSTYSFLDGYQLPEAHVRRATEVGMEALALTEHGNVSSHVKLEMAADKAGVKPIFGCELYMGPTDEDRRGQRKNHLTVLAGDQNGYKNLMGLVTQSWRDFYYEPTSSWDSLRKHQDGLIVLSGCTGSLLATSLVGGKNVDPRDASLERGVHVARKFKRLLGDRYYLEVQAFPELENVVRINKMIAEISAMTGIPMVATGDVHYTRLEENELQQILHNIRGGNRQTLEEQAMAWGYDVPLAPPTSDAAMLRRLRAAGLTKQQAVRAILATEEIAQRCNVTLPKMPMLRFPTHDSTELCWQWLRDGWRYRGIHRMSKEQQKVYADRVKYEMGVITEKDYVDYFLIVSDLVKFAKDSGIPVGPARGSAAASLVCYLLRITEIDPVFYSNLVFERFIDFSRTDLPDVDLDFDSNRRHEIKEYAQRKYGADHVGLIGTFTNFKSKNSLDDVARVYRIPQYRVDVVKDLLIERSSGDLRASATIEDTVEQFEVAKEVFDEYPDLRHAMELEGNIKGMGAHAAGLIISPAPLGEITAVYRRKVAGEENDVVGLDKWDVERQGMIKIDVLGLNTMSMIADALDMVGMTLEDLYRDVDMEDPRVIEGFRTADVVGIFQFDGNSMRQVTKSLKPDSFREIADINALARPGPLHNGSTARYVDAKWGRFEPERLHPLLDVITEDTYYQIVYQEQILRVVREIGDFDWTHAAYIRKIISKKLGEQEFERQFDRFWEGAQHKEGMTAEIAREIWNRCITAGSYAFNAAHSYSYGVLAVWTMWFKQYHPHEFYVAALRNYNPEKQLDLLKDAHRHGIAIRPPHPQHSGAEWSVAVVDGEKQILGGLTSIKGVGASTAQRMIEYREQNGVKTWDDYLAVKGVGPKTIDSIRAFCAKDDPYDILWLRRRIDRTIAALPELGLSPPTHTCETISSQRGVEQDVVWVGRILKRNQKDLFELHYSRTGEELDPESVKDPHLKDWVVMWADDDEEVMTITVDRWRYPMLRKKVWSIDLDKDLVWIRGKKKPWTDKRGIHVEKMEVIDPDG